MLTLPQNKVASFPPTALSARLSAIAESLPRGGMICDVGSDHGLLPLFLLEKGYCKSAIVTDLNPLPLKRAEHTLSQAGFSDRCQFILTDGISEILLQKPSAFVIAGMGGETIAGILERAKDRILPETYFALQPMTRPHLLRRFLYENGFRITGEKVVSENKKLFFVMFVTYDGNCRPGDDMLYFFGEFLPHQRTEETTLLWQESLRQVDAKIAGKKVARKDVSKENEIRRRLLELLEDRK